MIGVRNGTYVKISDTPKTSGTLPTIDASEDAFGAVCNEPRAEGGHAVMVWLPLWYKGVPMW